MKQRVYTIGVGDQVRLVRASNRRQAIAHVSLGIMTIRVATQEDIINQLDKGVPIENYTAPPESWVKSFSGNDRYLAATNAPFL